MNTGSLAKMLGMLVFPLTALAATAEPVPEPELKEIMQGLRDDVFVIADGMFTDDMDRIAQGAAGIAHHPSIPNEQVQRVAAELGPEMPAFKQFDQQVHELSVSIISAADSQDRDRVSADFQQLINGCLACHTSYKERVANVLKESDQ
jgi:cytochrome c556